MLTREEETKLIEPNRLRFFNPITLAKKDYEAKPDTISCRNVITKTIQISLAASAAYLVVEPSIRYAEDNGFDLVTIPASTILTGFAINLAAIDYLWNELRNAEGMQRYIILSFLIGAISALPAVFIQLMESADTTMIYRVLTSILVGIGSVPLQALGFFELFQMIGPRLRGLWDCGKNDPDVISTKEQLEVREYLLMQLENNCNTRVMLDNIPSQFLSMSEEELLFSLLQFNNVLTEKQKSRCKNTIAHIMGLIGVGLAETINISYSKSTYDIFSPFLPEGLTYFLTGIIVLPMGFLSAKFGFNALKYITEELFLLISHCKLKPPIGIQPIAGISSLFISTLVASRSYSALVQFNRDIFENNMEEINLSVLNGLTLCGGLIFNLYAMNTLSNRILCQFLSRCGNASTKEKTQFYEFNKKMLTNYQRLPHSLFLLGQEYIQKPTVDDIEIKEEKENHHSTEISMTEVKKESIANTI